MCSAGCEKIIITTHRDMDLNDKLVEITAP
jgi:hypothetical protein